MALSKAFWISTFIFICLSLFSFIKTMGFADANLHIGFPFTYSLGGGMCFSEDQGKYSCPSSQSILPLILDLVILLAVSILVDYIYKKRTSKS